MKIQIVTSFALFIAANSFAAKVQPMIVAQCSNGEETTVSIKQLADKSLRADVTVQSTGDSYPTYHFKNIVMEARDPRRLGAPTVYTGKGFSLSVNYTALGAPGSLSVSSLGLQAERLTCGRVR